MAIEMEKSGGFWQRLERRERVLVVIVGVIVLLALVYVLFLRGGGKEAATEAFPTARPTARATGTATPRATATPSSAPETNEVFEGKDPFRPLIVAGGVSGGGTTTGGTTGAPSSGGTKSSQRVTLVAIDGTGANRTATVEVNSTEYTAKAGETFAGSYRVKSLTADCGTFVFGDETFTLCVGQEVLK